MIEVDKDEALFLVDNAAYLHVWTTENHRNYTADGCYTIYNYTLYDKATQYPKESGDMELFDMRSDLPQNLRSAAENILMCRLSLNSGITEVVPLEMVAQLQNSLAAAEMSVEDDYNQIDGIINNGPKPSLLDNLRQCQQEAGRSQGGTAPPSPNREPER